MRLMPLQVRGCEKRMRMRCDTSGQQDTHRTLTDTTPTLPDMTPTPNDTSRH